jgi:hypothetical protein
MPPPSPNDTHALQIGICRFRIMLLRISQIGPEQCCLTKRDVRSPICIRRPLVSLKSNMMSRDIDVCVSIFSRSPQFDS